MTRPWEFMKFWSLRLQNGGNPQWAGVQWAGARGARWGVGAAEGRSGVRGRLRQRGVAGRLAPSWREVYTLCKESPVAERIGDFLVRTGAMQQAQVDEVIRVQKAGDKRSFGEIGVALGLVKPSAIQAFLSSRGK